MKNSGALSANKDLCNCDLGVLYLLMPLNVSMNFTPLLLTDTSSASEDEGSLRRQGRIASSSPYQAHPSVEHWFNRVIQGSSTSSSASSTSSHPGGRAHHATNTTSASAATVLADLMAHTQLGQYSHEPFFTSSQQLSFKMLYKTC